MRVEIETEKGDPCDSVKLVIEGRGEAEAFELGRLENQLQIADISHSNSFCAPPRIKITLKESS